MKSFKLYEKVFLSKRKLIFSCFVILLYLLIVFFFLLSEKSEYLFKYFQDLHFSSFLNNFNIFNMYFTPLIISFLILDQDKEFLYFLFPYLDYKKIYLVKVLVLFEYLLVFFLLLFFGINIILYILGFEQANLLEFFIYFFNVFYDSILCMLFIVFIFKENNSLYSVIVSIIFFILKVIIENDLNETIYIIPFKSLSIETISYIYYKIYMLLVIFIILLYLKKSKSKE
jgi:hypothetical protein